MPLLYAHPAIAHEFWIEPPEFQVQSGAPLVADLRNGTQFSGRALAYLEKRTARFDLVSGARTIAVTGRMGDIPALQAEAPGEGLLVIIHQTMPSTLTYKKWEKFRAFSEHKDFPDTLARHAARGLPQSNFTEVYTRYAKALIGVGNSIGADMPSGMETEFVALSNPYTDDPRAGFHVELLYQGAPRADAQIEVFDRAPDGVVMITLRRTDANGRAVIPVQPGHTYLLDAVVIRDAPEGGKPVWETLWAALTFAVPGQ